MSDRGLNGQVGVGLGRREIDSGNAIRVSRHRVGAQLSALPANDSEVDCSTADELTGVCLKLGKDSCLFVSIDGRRNGAEGKAKGRESARDDKASINLSSPNGQPSVNVVGSEGIFAVPVHVNDDIIPAWSEGCYPHGVGILVRSGKPHDVPFRAPRHIHQHIAVLPVVLVQDDVFANQLGRCQGAPRGIHPDADILVDIELVLELSLL